MLIGKGLLAIDLDNKGRIPALSETGLRLLANFFVLPHLNRYKSGVVEAGCETLVYAHPDASCLLIGGNTSVMIRHDQIGRLIGNGKTGIVERRGLRARSVVWLSGSERYDFRLRTLVH